MWFSRSNNSPGAKEHTMNEEKKKKNRTRKPGQWTIQDILLGLFGLAAIFALAVAGFKVAKWVMETYL